MESLPKVELHLHLDCSLSYKVVSCLNPGITQEQYRRTFIAANKCRDLAECLLSATPAVKLIQSEESLRLVVEDVFEQLVADRMLYAELRFAPLLHLEQGLTPETVVATVDRAVEDCIRGTGVEARIILCTLRHFTPPQSMATAKLVERFRGTRVVALDIAGDEAASPLAPHKAAYDYARECGAFLTAHAGEAAGPASVWETLRELAPSRIGHGVRSAEDGKLVSLLKDRHVHLEVCPTSNVQTNIYDTLKDHPVDRLYRAGVGLSINTDSRTMTGTDLGREYQGLKQAFGWGQSEFLACNLAAIQAAFLPDEWKQRLQEQLLAGYSQARSAS